MLEAKAVVKVSQDNLNYYDQILKISRDRNQGETLRTKIDMNRGERLRQGAETQVYSEAATAYATVSANIALLKPYQQQYLAQAVRVRDIVMFSYQHGGTALIDLLNAENDDRAVQLSYVSLTHDYLTAAAQLNQAVGREVLQ
jgi:outer membrane protein TolC